MTTLKNKQQLSRRKARQLIKSISKYINLSSNKFVHHLDEDPFNNNLDNLIILSNSTHTKLHWILNPNREMKGRKPKSLKKLFEELEGLLIVYNFDR